MSTRKLVGRYEFKESVTADLCWRDTRQVGASARWAVCDERHAALYKALMDARGLLDEGVNRVVELEQALNQTYFEEKGPGLETHTEDLHAWSQDAWEAVGGTSANYPGNKR